MSNASSFTTFYEPKSCDQACVFEVGRGDSGGEDIQGGDDIAKFAWQDGPFLSALKAGKWILLDELNLATQSVLEGLNACLDHRGEVFIPELNRTFIISSSQVWPLT